MTGPSHEHAPGLTHQVSVLNAALALLNATPTMPVGHADTIKLVVQRLS